MARVMLVEDDNNLREIYEARMVAEGYDVVTAKDGEEALVVAKANQPDLVISDVMMPKISGFEMLDILRNTQGLKEVKVIMLTALGQSDDQLRADKLGADRYLVKSQVTLEDIVQSAHDLLEGETPAAEELGLPATEPTAEPVVTETPVTEAPTPVAVAPTPEPVLAVEPAPVAVEPTPAPVVETPAPKPVQPTPEPVAVAEPAAYAPATPTAIANDTQSMSQEAAAVEAQIEDFIAGAAQADIAPVAQPTPEPVAQVAVEPTVQAPAEQIAPTPVVQAAPVSPDPAQDSSAAQDDKLIADAVDAFAANTAVAPDPTPAPSIAPPASDDTTPAPITEAAGGKKVISPIQGIQAPDINQLLAQEEAKEIAAQPAPAPEPVAPPVAPATVVTPVAVEGPAEQIPEATPVDAPLPDTVTFAAPVVEETPVQQQPAPTPAPAPQPAPQAAAAPAPVAPQPAPTKPAIDPNSIAL